MFEYSAEQHFQFGYQDPVSLTTRWLDRRRHSAERFVARYGRAPSKVASWREANRLAATRILATACGRDLVPTLLYSGGIDSEIMLTAFLEALEESRTPLPLVRIATLRLSGDLNSHDLQYVEKFKSRFENTWRTKISVATAIEFFELEHDAEAFWQSQEFSRLARETQLVTPMLVSHLRFCEMLLEDPRALPVIGQGEMHLVREASAEGYQPAPWSVVETEPLCALYRFFIQRGRAAVPGFFQYLPEQFESQLRTNPVLHDLLAHQRYGKLGTRTSKAEIVGVDYPELERREKFHGFEHLQEEHDRVRALLFDEFPEYRSMWKQDVFSLYRALAPRMSYPLPQTALPPSDQGGWRCAWGRGGVLHDRRSDADDIFVTWREDAASAADAIIPLETFDFGSLAKPSPTDVLKLALLEDAAAASLQSLILAGRAIMARGETPQLPDLTSLQPTEYEEIAHPVLVENERLGILSRALPGAFIASRQHGAATAMERASGWDEYRDAIHRHLVQCAVPAPAYQAAAFDLERGQCVTEIDLPKFARLFDARPLKVISDERWLEVAREQAPGLRLGSNLFFSQKLSGPLLCDPRVRLSVALLGDPDDRSGNEIAWLHICAIADDRLRLRGVTTRIDRKRQGCATRLIALVVERLREARRQGLAVSGIDVYAAPEVEAAFRQVGFQDDFLRRTKPEDGIDAQTGALVSLDRQLTPLSLELAE